MMIWFVTMARRCCGGQRTQRDFSGVRLRAAEAVERLILTASGGPFRTLDRAAMARVTPEQAVAHPVWDMAPKSRWTVPP